VENGMVLFSKTKNKKIKNKKEKGGKCK